MLLFFRTCLVRVCAAGVVCAGVSACGQGNGEASAQIAPRASTPGAAAASSAVTPPPDGLDQAASQPAGAAPSDAGKPPPEDQDHVTLTAEQRSELAGPDADGNGVRDDIDAWIAKNFANSIKARAVWTARARIQEQVMLATSKVESRALSKAIGDAVDCTGEVLEPLGWTGSQLQATGNELLSLLLNSSDRLRAFDRAEGWASGTLIEGRAWEVSLAEVCGFDPNKLPN